MRKKSKIVYHRLLNLHRPNACSIHRRELAQLLAFALNCILNVLVVLVQQGMMGGIRLFHVHKNNAVRIPLNSPEYYSNSRIADLCIRMCHYQCNAFVLYRFFFFFHFKKKTFIGELVSISKDSNKNNFNVFCLCCFCGFNWIFAFLSLPGQHFGTIARNDAGSGAHSKHCGSKISRPNVEGHSIFSQ